MGIKKLLRLFIFSLLVFTPLACYVEDNLTKIADTYQTGQIISSRPVAKWKLNDIEGSAAFDSSGHNNHGTVHGATWSGNALSFDGRDDYVKVPDSPILRPARITVEAWIKPKKISQAVLLEKAPSGVYPPKNGWEIFISTETEPKNTIATWILNREKGEACVIGETVIHTDKWYHIAMTYDGAWLNLYVNGGLEGSKPDTAGIGDNSPASLTIGYSGYWNRCYFNGLMRDAKIYNYAKSQSEIQAEYSRNMPEDSVIESTQRNDGPVAEWKLNDIEGATAFDSSGNNNHGTVHGAAWSGNTLSFDGKDDYVRIPNAPALNPTGSFSIDAWIFPTTNNYGHILTKWGDTGDWAGQRSYALSTSSGRLTFGISDDAHQQDSQFHTFWTPENVLTIKAWNHITAIYDQPTGTRKIYVNGSKVAQRIDAPINLTMSRADVAIGAHLASSTIFRSTFFPGLISQVKIYNYARSPAEIRADYYNAPKIETILKKHQPIASDGDWTMMNPDRAPSARYGTAMAYDSARQKTVIFGGTFTGKDSIKDTWEWDGANWARKRPANSPSTRGFSAMAYDPVRKKTVLFGGGYYGSVYFNDTWEWDGINWTLKSPDNKPSARVWPVMVYDSARQKMVLFGGFHEGSYLDDTWEWDGTNWRRLYPEISPPGRHYHTMAYDAERQKTVLFGGWIAWDSTTNQTWEWDGTNWAFKSPANKPSARTAPAMAYDPVRGKTILFGGGPNDDTWEWNGTDWTQVMPAIYPSTRNQHKMGYDLARRKIILFGGATESGANNETWEYGAIRIPTSNYAPITSAWKRKANMPTARSIIAVGVANNKIYAIGGYDGNKVLCTNEEYDPTTNRWTARTPMPTPREGFAIGVVNNKIYAIGGYDGTNNYATNEEYDPVRKRWITRAPMPTPRRCLAIGVANNKVYAIGGYGSHDLNTVEEYDPATDSWTKKSGLAVARHGIFVGVVNNKIYCIAGRTLIRDYNVFNTNEEYDPLTDSWTTKTNMPVVKGSFDIGVVNNNIYAIGGYDNDNNCAVATNYEYDPRTNIWTKKTDIPAPRCNFSIGVVNDKIYVIGGTIYKFNDIVLRTNEEYDPSLDYSNHTSLPDDWKRKANMPTARSGYVSGVVNNKIYVIGGTNNDTNAIDTNEEYDPVTSRWTFKAPMPTARANCSIGVINNKIYVIGGWDFSNGCTTNEEYDPALNTWTIKASMPTTRKGAGFGVVNNKIYVIGGENASVRFNTNEEYNPVTNRWSTKAPMPSYRNAVMSAVVNGRIYIIGGANSSGTFLKTNQAYNPRTNTWASKADMPTARVNAACDTFNNKIYVIGGLTSNANSLATNEEYNPALDAWAIKTNMPTARDNMSGCVVNNKIYIIGGGSSFLGGIININEQYDPSLDR